jgi:Spy/CpxP family protein refolding chaperone
MTMRLKVFAAVATMAALGVAMAWAQEPRRERPRGGIAQLQADIGLTDQQVSQIRKVVGQERKAAIRRNADMRVARMELQELMSAPTLDEAAISAKVKALGELQAAAFKARTESRLSIRRLVSADQFQKMQGHRRAMRARGERRGPGRMGPGRRGPGAAPAGPDGGEELPAVDPS